MFTFGAFEIRNIRSGRNLLRCRSVVVVIVLRVREPMNRALRGRGVINGRGLVDGRGAIIVITF